MIPRWLSKVLLAVALMVMPFQGIAAALTALSCHGERAAHGHDAPAAHHDHDGGHAHEPGPSAHDDADGHGGLYHLCCNLSASMPASVTFIAALPEFTPRQLVPATLLDLYDPEQLQRP